MIYYLIYAVVQALVFCWVIRGLGKGPLSMALALSIVLAPIVSVLLVWESLERITRWYEKKTG